MWPKLIVSKLIQGFRRKADDLPFTNALSGFVLAQLSLGSRQQSIRLITVCLLVSLYVCACFCTCASHALGWKARDPHDSIVQNSYQQFAERAAISLAQCCHCACSALPTPVWRENNLQDPSAPFCYTALMQEYANLVACQDRLVKACEWVRLRLD